MTSKNILIVEDEGVIAHDLKLRVERAGFTVVKIVDNMNDALEAAEALRPDVVFMDIRIKGDHDGIETARRIGLQFHIPVIFMTAHADAETLERAQAAGPFGYLVKPFINVDFRVQIEMALWKHKVERALRISEARLAATFRNVADGLVATDPEGNIAFLNGPAAELTGWGAEEAKGVPFLEVFHAFDEKTGQPLLNPMEAVYDDREPQDEAVTLRLWNKGREKAVIVEARITANRDEGVLLGMIAVFRDVTERRAVEQRERRVEKVNALSLLATGISKDLARSVRRIDTALQSLMPQLSDRALRAATTALVATGEADALACQLDELGNAETARRELMDANSFIREWTPAFSKAAGRRHELAVTLRDPLPMIEVNISELRQSLMRLMEHARNAMPDGGTIEMFTTLVTGENGSQEVEIGVRDHGERMRNAGREQAFDPYYQSRPKTRHLAISLALVYHFVSLNEGTAQARSSFEEGTAFTMRFPAVAEVLQIGDEQGTAARAANGQ